MGKSGKMGSSTAGERGGAPISEATHHRLSLAACGPHVGDPNSRAYKAFGIFKGTLRWNVKQYWQITLLEYQKHQPYREQSLRKPEKMQKQKMGFKFPC